MFPFHVTIRQSEINGNTNVAGRRVMTEQDIKTKHMITMPRGWIRRKKGSIKAACIDMERELHVL